MLTTVRAKIGFISSSAPSSAHHKSFQAFVPKDVDFTAVQDKTVGDSLYDARGKLDALIGQTVELVEKYAWNGVIISGAPKEVLNPGLWHRLSSALNVPVATAPRSSVEALTVLAVKRVLLMTPVDDLVTATHGTGCEPRGGFTETVKQKPCALITDAEHAFELLRTHAFLG